MSRARPTLNTPRRGRSQIAQSPSIQWNATVVSVTSDSPTEFIFPTSLCTKTIGIDGPDFANVVEKIEVWPAYFGCTASAMLSCTRRSRHDQCQYQGKTHEHSATEDRWSSSKRSGMREGVNITFGVTSTRMAEAYPTETLNSVGWRGQYHQHQRYERKNGRYRP